MIAVDPLRTVELLALLEEATAPLNHDVRNRLASVRNLAFVVGRKLMAEPNSARDPRLQELLNRIEREVERTDETISLWSARIQAARPPGTARVRALECARLAIACTRLPNTVRVELSSTSGDEVEVDAEREVLAFAVRCLIENAGEAAGSGVVTVSAEPSGDQYRFTVSDNGPGFGEPPHGLTQFTSSKVGHLGLGLSMARRIASRLEGELVVGGVELGAAVSLLIPLAADSNASPALDVRSG